MAFELWCCRRRPNSPASFNISGSARYIVDGGAIPVFAFFFPRLGGSEEAGGSSISSIRFISMLCLFLNFSFLTLSDFFLLQKPNGPKLRPPKMSSSAKTTSSNQDEIEIEIAEVLYGMQRQPQGPTKQEIVVTDSIKFESREANKSTSDAKSRVSSPISNSPCALPQLPSAFTQNSSSSVTSLSAVGGYFKLSQSSVLFISCSVPQCSVWLLRD